MPTSTPELKNPDLIAIANNIANVAILAIQKAIAHNTMPSKWPIGDPQSLE